MKSGPGGVSGPAHSSFNAKNSVYCPPHSPKAKLMLQAYFESWNTPGKGDDAFHAIERWIEAINPMEGIGEGEKALDHFA